MINDSERQTKNAMALDVKMKKSGFESQTENGYRYRTKDK